MIIASCLHVETSVVSSMVIEKMNALTYPSSSSGNGLLKHFNNTFHLCFLTLNMRNYLESGHKIGNKSLKWSINLKDRSCSLRKAAIHNAAL